MTVVGPALRRSGAVVAPTFRSAFSDAALMTLRSAQGKL